MYGPDKGFVVMPEPKDTEFACLIGQKFRQAGRHIRVAYKFDNERQTGKWESVTARATRADAESDATPMTIHTVNFRSFDYGPAGAAAAAADYAGAAVPFRDYGPAGSSGPRRRLRQGRSTFRGTTGRTDPPTDYAGVHRGTRTIGPRDLPGAGRSMSQLPGIRS